jgi:adenylate cyclase
VSSSTPLAHLRGIILRVFPHSYRLLVPLLVAVLTVLGSEWKALDRLENFTVDLRFRFRHWVQTYVEARKPETERKSYWHDERLMLVGIEEASLKNPLYGRWPWKRSMHGDMVQLLAHMEPSPEVIVFDLLFTESGATEFDRKEDDALGKGFESFGRVVTAAKLLESFLDKAPKPPGNLHPTLPLFEVEGDLKQVRTQKSAEFPIAPILPQSFFGFVDVNPTSSDGIRREIPMIVRVGDECFASLTLQSLIQYWRVPVDGVRVVLGKEIVLDTHSEAGTRRIPIDERGNFLINFRTKDFRNFDFSQLKTAMEQHLVKGAELPKEFPDLSGKILVIGQTAEGLTDFGPTPLDPFRPLVHLHVQVLDNILQQDFLKKVPMIWMAVVWLLLAWVTIFGVQRTEIATAVALPLCIMGGYVVFGFGLLFWNYQIPLFWPLLGFGALHLGDNLIHWIEENQKQRQIRQVFSSYIDEEVMNLVLKRPDSLRLKGARKEVAIMFSDIRGFTSISESINEEQLVDLLNEYFEPMVRCIRQGHHGTLHKFIGDAIMAGWGDVVPASSEESARSAVRCALQMRRELAKLNYRWKNEGRKPLKIGIGINFGAVTVGDIGAAGARREFTIIGDPVNVASRLEGVTKHFRTDLVISDTVRELLNGDFVVRTVGLIQVKGRNRPLRVYEVLGEVTDTELSGKWRKEDVDTYEKAVDLYFRREFAKAMETLSPLAKAYPESHYIQKYMKLSREFQESPPPPDWNGVEIMETK